eukprot:SAG31_NODE_1296_length_8945_cov_6.341510_10_plen_54_part_00
MFCLDDQTARVCTIDDYSGRLNRKEVGQLLKKLWSTPPTVAELNEVMAEADKV